MHGGTEEWRLQRAFKAKLGDRLRIRFPGTRVTEAAVAAWFTINHKKILKRDFETAICELGFNRGNDETQLTALFESLKRGAQDKYIFEDALRKMLNQMKQAAEASQQEVRDVDKVEAVLGKKIDEIDKL